MRITLLGSVAVLKAVVPVAIGAWLFVRRLGKDVVKKD